MFPTGSSSTPMAIQHGLLEKIDNANRLIFALSKLCQDEEQASWFSVDLATIRETTTGKTQPISRYPLFLPLLNVLTAPCFGQMLSERLRMSPSLKTTDVSGTIRLTCPDSWLARMVEANNAVLDLVVLGLEAKDPLVSLLLSLGDGSIRSLPDAKKLTRTGIPIFKVVPQSESPLYSLFV